MTAEATDVTQSLIDVARGTVQDLQQTGNTPRRLSLDCTLDRDLGLDSLARVELFARIEKTFGVQLPVTVFEHAVTLRDIAAALETEPSLVALPRRPAGAATAHQAAAAPAVQLGTLDEVLAWHTEHHPDFVQITICEERGDVPITYSQLWGEARVIAGGLQQQGVRIGDTIALMLPTSRDYFCAFFGILLAGAVPVPLYPPTRMTQIEDHVRRHAAILKNAGAATLITIGELHRLATVLRAHAPSLRHVTTTAELTALGATPWAVRIDARAPALLQYTSGSTGQPKGVVVSHANMLTNISCLAQALRIDSDDVFVSWLPLYHDMGLIGAWLGTLYLGLPLKVMSPLAFLMRPVRWLEALHRYRGTLSAAPNFAYELCSKRITDAEIENIDLSTWRIAMNGSEAVMPDTLQRFQQRFARCGFRETAMTPVYGLAETSVGLTVPPPERGPLIDTIDRDLFMSEGVAAPVNSSAVSPLRFVSCGLPIPEHQVRIVDERRREVAERREGRLEFRGPSATSGYFRNPEATAALLHDGWLDSGDRAYLANGEIFLSGRIKDIIIRAGRHIYPEELEAAVGALAGIRKGCVAVFGSRDSVSGTERVVVLAETRASARADRDALYAAILREVIALIGEPPDDIVLCEPHTIPKTSSGKLRRSASRELYESGRHLRSQRARGASMQMLRLAVGALQPGSRLLLRRIAELAYGAYFWTLLATLGSVAFVLLLLPMRLAFRWATIHRLARTLIRMARIPFVVEGREHLRGEQRRIIVANHSSYLDGIFLAATLPFPCRFVAKRELARVPVLGSLLRRMGSEFVERFDARESVQSAHHLAAAAAEGPSSIYFPEGTFTRAPGLMPFHLGGFAAAVAANTAVLPIALRGTRALLRDEQWLPRRTAVVAHVDAPIAPRPGGAFAESVRLRNAARDSIRAHCGEPDLLGTVPNDSTMRQIADNP